MKPKPKKDKRPRVQEIRSRTFQAFDTRTEMWAQAGLEQELDRGDARRARIEAAILLVLIIAVIIIFAERNTLFPDAGKWVKYVTAGLLALLGWGLARTIAKGLAPALFRRMEPGTAGTVGFLIRLATIGIVVIVALRVAGGRPETLAVGGAFTAVVLGLAAQQTLSHVFAGLVLQTTRPFRVGDRVKLRGGSMAGEVDGTVSSLGLFYTTLLAGTEKTMIPNNLIMMLAVVPIANPDQVELRAKFNASVTPRALQRTVEKAVTIPLRTAPHVTLEELDGDEITVTISAVPLNSADGGRLASDILAAVRDSDLDGRPDGYEPTTDPDQKTV